MNETRVDPVLSKASQDDPKGEVYKMKLLIVSQREEISRLAARNKELLEACDDAQNILIGMTSKSFRFLEKVIEQERKL